MKNQKMMKKPMKDADDYGKKGSNGDKGKKMPANKLMMAGGPKSKKRDC